MWILYCVISYVSVLSFTCCTAVLLLLGETLKKLAFSSWFWFSLSLISRKIISNKDLFLKSHIYYLWYSPSKSRWWILKYHLPVILTQVPKKQSSQSRMKEKNKSRTSVRVQCFMNSCKGQNENQMLDKFTI